MMARDFETGSTLIMTTWLLIMITVIAGFLLYRAELEWAVTLDLEQNRKVEELAEKILSERVALLTADENDYDAPTEPWFGGDGVFAEEIDGYQVTVMVEDEGSKPKLNLLTQNGLAQLLTGGMSPDPLLDWIDPDDEVRDEGAERQYYEGLSPAYRPRNGFMASVRELLQVKDGAAYYQELAPVVTVYGKYNPNTLTAEQFEGLLLAYGFDRHLAETAAEQFRTYRLSSRFELLDDLANLAAVSISSRQKLEPILQFDGVCNLNLVSQIGLDVILSETGRSKYATEVAQRRRVKPFETVDEIKVYFKAKDAEFKAEDYFGVVSTVFRYRIWLQKNSRTFYYETARERVAGSGRQKWRIRSLSWLELKDAAAPPLPKTNTDGDREDNEQEGGEPADAQ